MRFLPVLLLLAAPLFAEPADVASRFPADPSFYIEARGIGPKIAAFKASPLGRTILNHPAYKALLHSGPGRKLMMGQVFLRGAIGMDLDQLFEAIAGEQIGLAIYGSPDRTVIIAHMNGETAERLVSGAEILAKTERVEIAPPDEKGPALWQLGPLFFTVEEGLFALSNDQILAMSIRSHESRGIDASEEVAVARRAVGESDLFGFVKLDAFRKELEKGGKPKDLGEALLLGAFAHVLPEAPWVAFGAGLDPAAGEAWRLHARACLPAPEAPQKAVAAAYEGVLAPLPFALPEHTVGVVRLHRDLQALWAHRSELIAERGLPDLVEFETNFGNITSGMSWVEEFLPNAGAELTLIGMRETYDAGHRAPVPQIPQGAILWKVKNPEQIATRLQLAYQTLMVVVNADQAQMKGTPLLSTVEEYKGVRCLTARFMKPSEAEMEGRQGLPMRYNFSPSAAVVGDQLVLASGLDILKKLIDGREGVTRAPAGTNAGFWLNPSELRALLAANREALVAQSMLKNADSRVEAEHKIDLALDLGRMLRSVSLLSRERAGTLGLDLEALLGPGGN